MTRIRRSPRRRDAGVTLLEILIVLAIVALLAAVAGPRVIGYLNRSKTTVAALQIDNLRVGLELFYIDVGRYPSESEGLSALVGPPPGAPDWSGPYLDAADALIDPWGRGYVYRTADRAGGRAGDQAGDRAGRRSFLVYSLGADGLDGGAGEDADIGR